MLIPELRTYAVLASTAINLLPVIGLTIVNGFSPLFSISSLRTLIPGAAQQESSYLTETGMAVIPTGGSALLEVTTGLAGEAVSSDWYVVTDIADIASGKQARTGYSEVTKADVTGNIAGHKPRKINGNSTEVLKTTAAKDMLHISNLSILNDPQA